MNRFVPPNLIAVRREVLRSVSAVLEHQVRSEVAFAAMATTLRRVLDELLDQVTDEAATGSPAAAWDRLAQRLRTLNQTSAIIQQRYGTEAARQRQAVRELLLSFEASSRSLAETLIEKDLLDRHRRVLERIVLSYERVINWLAFVEEVLQEFLEIFPFDLFFLAFAEKHGLTAHLFYAGKPRNDQRNALEPALVSLWLAQLGQNPEAAINLEVHTLSQRAWCGSTRVEDYQILAQSVPDQRSGLAGILGVGFVTVDPLSPQEESVVRALLAILVIVVGSGRALADSMRELEFYAIHDSLTHLYNRHHFVHMLEYEVGRSQRHGHRFSLIMIDLDDFKDVNDTYGHPVGDMALREVAAILSSSIRQGDLACRIGGDEFALLLPETPVEGAMYLARKIRDQLRHHRFQSGQIGFHLTCSFGVVGYPEDGDRADLLLAHADLAAYEAKRRGKDEVFHYGEKAGPEARPIQMREALVGLRHAAEVLRTALEEQRIVPYFQPIVSLADGKIFAYEVLARLIEPSGEVVSAGRFITAIEKYGLGRELDRRILAAALKVVRDCGACRPTLFFNLSVQEIENRNVLGLAARLCHQWGIDPQQVVFELLERDAVQDLEKLRRFTQQLRKKGFRFALDDFGSGYNSFHYLRELALDFVKIDGSFVRGIINSSVDEALVRNLARLCQDLGIATIAEFIENDEILRRVQAMGITYGQGYHLGLPLPHLPMVQSPLTSSP